MKPRVFIDKTLSIRRKGGKWRIVTRGLNGALVVARGNANEKLDGGGYVDRDDAARRLKRLMPESELIRLDTQREQAAKEEIDDVRDGETPAGTRHLGEGRVIPSMADIAEEPPLWMTPQDVFYRRAGNPIRAYGDCCRAAEGERIYRERLVAADPDNEVLRANHMDATVRHAGLLGHVMRYMLPTYSAISVQDTRGDNDLSIDEARSILAEVTRSVDAVAAVSGCDDTNVPRGTLAGQVETDGD